MMDAKQVAALAFLVLAGLLTVGVGVTGGGVVADGSPLQEMEGSGTADDPYVITTVEELQAMDDDRGAHYVLGNDIDASSTAGWNGGAGFVPIGGDAGLLPARFTGTFDGNGHTISGLTIDRDSSRAAFVPRLTGVVENVTFEAAVVEGAGRTAVVVAQNDGTIRNVSASGEVSGAEAVGGIAGDSDGTITNATSRVDVSGTEAVGGVVGHTSGAVTVSSASGAVSGSRQVGGLVGTLAGEITVSYASGNVSGETDVGGLVGNAQAEDGDERLADTYATGGVTGNQNVGGLVGRLQTQASRSFAAGSVSGTVNVGGVVGRLEGPVPTDLAWDRDATGQQVGIGAGNAPIDGASTDGLTGTAATGLAFYSPSVWTATDSYPIFDWQLQGIELTITDSPVVAGNTTQATVRADLVDGTTLTASETASYDVDTGVATVDEGLIEARAAGETDVTASLGGYSASATLAVLAPADISLVDATLAADGAVAGSVTALDATFRNAGEVSGTAPVVVTVDGEVVANTTVAVADGAEETVTLRWDVPGEPGEYDVSVAGSDAGTLTVVFGTAVSLTGVDAPDIVSPGEGYDVEASFENSVDVPLAVIVTYEGGDGEQARIVVVEPGESTVTFTETAPDAAGQSVEHAVGYGGATGRTAVAVAERASFSIASLDGPETVDSGGTIEVTVTVENTGGVEGTTEVRITVDGEEVATETVTVAGGGTAEVTATAPVDAEGSVAYSAGVGDDEQSGSATVHSDGDDGDDDGSAGDADDDGTDDGGESTDDDEADGGGSTDDADGAGFGVAVALGALLCVTVVGARQL